MSNAIPLPPLPFGWWKDKVTESEMEHFIHAHAAAVSADKDARIKVLEDALWAADLAFAEHGILAVHATRMQVRAALGDKNG